MRNKFLGMLLVMIMFIGCGTPNKVKFDDPNLGWDSNETVGDFRTYKGKPYNGILLKDDEGGYVEIKNGLEDGKAKYTQYDPEGKLVIDGAVKGYNLVGGTSEFYMKNMRGEWVLRSRGVVVDDPIYGKVLEEYDYYNEINNADKALANPTKIARHQLNGAERGLLLNGRYINSEAVGYLGEKLLNLGFNGYLIGGRFFGYTVLSLDGGITVRVDLAINQTVLDLTILYSDFIEAQGNMYNLPKFEQGIMKRYLTSLYSIYLPYANLSNQMKLNYFDDNGLKELSKKKLGVYIDPAELANAEAQQGENGYKKYLFTGALDHKTYSNKSQFTKGISFKTMSSGNRVDFWISPFINTIEERKAKKADAPRYSIEIAIGNKMMTRLLDEIKGTGPEIYGAIFENEEYGIVAKVDKEEDFNEKDSYYVVKYTQNWNGEWITEVNRIIQEDGDYIVVPIFKEGKNGTVLKYNIEQQKWITMKNTDVMLALFQTLIAETAWDLVEYHKTVQVNLPDPYQHNINEFIQGYKSYLKDKEIK